MRGFLIGALCNVLVVFVGFLVLGVLTTLFIRSGVVAGEQVGTEGYNLWVNAVTYVLNGLVAAGAGFAHVRLTPKRLLGAVPVVTAAALLACVVNAVLNVPFLTSAMGEWTHTAWLLAMAALGAVLGGTFAARGRARS